MPHPPTHLRRSILIFAAAAFGIAGGACKSGGETSGGGPGTGASGSGGATATSSGGGTTLPGGSGSSGTSSSGGGANTGSGGATTGASSYDCASPGPGWIFCEDFEAMAGGYDAWRQSWGWTDAIGADDPGRMAASNDAHGGQWAVHYPAAESAGYRGADLIYRPCVGENKTGCELERYDTLYVRTWVKLAPDHQRVHHFLNISGSQQFWEAYGNAGCRPNGYRAMGTTVDFRANTHETFFYTYFPGMGCDPGDVCNNYADAQAICDECAMKDMPCSNGLECCWGNNFAPEPAVALPVGQWVCVEMMMQANTPGAADGKMAYWIDDALAYEKTGMEWRTTADLGLNMVRLQHYITTGDAMGFSNQVWFDDVVVSTERVGCSP